MYTSSRFSYIFYSTFRPEIGAFLSYNNQLFTIYDIFTAARLLD